MLKNPVSILLITVCSLMLSCAPGPVFRSYNSLQQVPGTLYLSNGDSVSGRLTLNSEVLFPKDILVEKEGDAAGSKIHLLDVKGYTAGGEHYELKHTKNGVHPANGFSFMRRLTPANSRFHVYENKEKKIKGKAYNNPVYEPVYYIQFPGERRHRVWAIDSRKLVPHFNKKMQAVVAGCPSLAKKIRDKEEGYFYSKLNLSDKDPVQVLLNIAAEYTLCNER